MFRTLRTALPLLAAVACGVGHEPPAPGHDARRAESSSPRAKPGPSRAAAPTAAPGPTATAGRDLALAVLRHGAAAIPASEESTDDFLGRPGILGPGKLRKFLERPEISSAVQFGCSVRLCEEEVALVQALTESRDDDAVVALAALVRVRAPRDVESQWRTLCRLDLRHRDDPGWRDVLAELRRPFLPREIDAALAVAPPADPYESASALEWAARAGGVTGHAGALPRLVELSRHEHLDVSLAAGRSLEDFPGAQGDEALAACLLGWRYDASRRAGRALCDRNPALLERTLRTADVPPASRRDAGLLLARVDSAAAVPHLCATVGGTAIVDGEMFDAIERLTIEEQLALVESLPASVREEQRERAAEVLAAVRRRLRE